MCPPSVKFLFLISYKSFCPCSVNNGCARWLQSKWSFFSFYAHNFLVYWRSCSTVSFCHSLLLFLSGRFILEKETFSSFVDSCSDSCLARDAVSKVVNVFLSGRAVRKRISVWREKPIEMAWPIFNTDIRSRDLFQSNQLRGRRGVLRHFLIQCMRIRDCSVASPTIFSHRMFFRTCTFVSRSRASTWRKTIR